MKNNVMKSLAATSILMFVAQTMLAEDPAVLLTKGRVAAELGDLEKAAEYFRAARYSTGASEVVRVESLLGLGRAEKSLGHSDPSIAAFSEVDALATNDPDLRWLLAEAVTGVVPDPRHWLESWREIDLGVGHSSAGEAMAVMLWPSMAAFYAEREFAGDPISMQLKDASLSDVLSTFSMISGLDIVLGPCVADLELSMGVDDIPWDRAFYDILGSRGLSAEIADGEIRVVCPKTEDVELPERWKQAGFSVKNESSASLYVSVSKANSLPSAGMCRAQPIHEVSLNGQEGQEIPQALALALEDWASGRGVVRIDVCGRAEGMKEIFALTSQIKKSKLFYQPTFREIRHEANGGLDFLMTVLFNLD